jgi:hypothetical protein
MRAADERASAPRLLCAWLCCCSCTVYCCCV